MLESVRKMQCHKLDEVFTNIAIMDSKLQHQVSGYIFLSEVFSLLNNYLLFLQKKYS